MSHFVFEIKLRVSTYVSTGLNFRYLQNERSSFREREYQKK